MSVQKDTRYRPTVDNVEKIRGLVGPHASDATLE